jgi:hypothetical protein
VPSTSPCNTPLQLPQSPPSKGANGTPISLGIEELHDPCSMHQPSNLGKIDGDNQRGEGQNPKLVMVPNLIGQNPKLVVVQNGTGQKPRLEVHGRTTTVKEGTRSIYRIHHLTGFRWKNSQTSRHSVPKNLLGMNRRAILVRSQ